MTKATASPPRHFLCYFTGKIMKDPAGFEGSGNSFEYGAIKMWTELYSVDPENFEPLSEMKIRKDKELQDLIHNWQRRHECSSTPADHAEIKHSVSLKKCNTSFGRRKEAEKRALPINYGELEWTPTPISRPPARCHEEVFENRKESMSFKSSSSTSLPSLMEEYWVVQRSKPEPGRQSCEDLDIEKWDCMHAFIFVKKTIFHMTKSAKESDRYARLCVSNDIDGLCLQVAAPLDLIEVGFPPPMAERIINVAVAKKKRSVMMKAFALLHGMNEEIHTSRGRKMMMKAMDYGDEFATAYCRFHQWTQHSDRKPAVERFRVLAEAGDTYAMYYFGHCLHHGSYVERSPELAVKWYTLAAESGHSSAQTTLGWCYSCGFGLPRKSTKDAIKWYMKAAKQGEVNAFSNLSSCYEFGLGVTKNLTLAAGWLKKAAGLGSLAARYRLGEFYYDGIGVSQSYEKAFRNFLWAAELGHIHAQFRVGLAYESGIGVPASVRLATEWFRKVAGPADPPSSSVDNENDVDNNNNNGETNMGEKNSAAQGASATALNLQG